jgi:hypothetical protein
VVKEKDITPHIPVFDKSNRTDGTFSRADFAFDAERDRYTCPGGKELVQFRRTYAIPRSGVTAEGTSSIAPANWIATNNPSKPFSETPQASPSEGILDGFFNGICATPPPGVDVKRSSRIATGDDEVGENQRPQSARREERIAVGQLQLRQSLSPGGLRFDLAGLGQPASSACASAISDISGVGVKPTRVGARSA